jgi:hypothetical protein
MLDHRAQSAAGTYCSRGESGVMILSRGSRSRRRTRISMVASAKWTPSRRASRQGASTATNPSLNPACGCGREKEGGGHHTGCPLKLTQQSQKEARQRRAEGATLEKLAECYNFGVTTMLQIFCRFRQHVVRARTRLHAGFKGNAIHRKPCSYRISRRTKARPLASSRC